MVWVGLSVAACGAILAWMYRRSNPAGRTSGLLFVVGWLAITAPVAYYRLEMNGVATASSAVVGLAILAAGTRGRLDPVTAQLDGSTAVDKSDDETPSVSDWLFIVGPVAILAAVILWPT